MSEPFIGEIKMVGFNFAPKGWAFTDGQILPINQNQSLYSLLGTTYGGDGRTSFALPDLRGRTPVHKGNGLQLGQKGGAETVTLTTAEMGAHTHQVKGTTADADKPSTGNNANRAFATVQPGQGDPNDIIYGDAANLVDLANGIVPNAGGGQAHDNMQPTMTLSFAIALQGLFPSRN